MRCRGPLFKQAQVQTRLPVTSSVRAVPPTASCGPLSRGRPPGARVMSVVYYWRYIETKDTEGRPNITLALLRTGEASA
jgi:hypothetical protein